MPSSGVVTVQLEVDKSEVLRMATDKIETMLKEADVELVFWDTEELRRRTKMCWNTIQQNFFYDPRFPKRKVGTKWYFPSRETRAFLETWLREQPDS